MSMGVLPRPTSGSRLFFHSVSLNGEAGFILLSWGWAGLSLTRSVVGEAPPLVDRSSMESGCYFLYIVRCADGTLYTGIARDLTRRMLEHNGLTATGAQSKRGARYTAARRPVELIYSETHETRSLASKREAHIKKLTRAEKLKLAGV